MKPRTPTPAMDALIGDEEKVRKKEARAKKERGSSPPTQLPWTGGNIFNLFIILANLKQVLRKKKKIIL